MQPGDRFGPAACHVRAFLLGKFAQAEGKLGGEFYTPRCIVRVLVEMIEPYEGRVYGT